MPLSRHGVETYQETSSHATRQGTLGQSSQLAEPLWTDPGLVSGISLHELISTFKKKSIRGMNCQTFSENTRTRGKSHHHHVVTRNKGPYSSSQSIKSVTNIRIVLPT